MKRTTTTIEADLVSLAEQVATDDAPMDLTPGVEVTFGWCPHRVSVPLRDDEASLLSPEEFKRRCEAAASLAATLSLRAKAVDTLEELDDLIAQLQDTVTGATPGDDPDEGDYLYAGADEPDIEWPPFGDTFKLPA